MIASLASKTAHVPFRDSKLTYLLQDSLGKDNKTLMIVQARRLSRPPRVVCVWPPPPPPPPPPRVPCAPREARALALAAGRTRRALRGVRVTYWGAM